ncbi:glycine zipper 2TM domain-containing protein [Paraburkholderia humisilvae]|uniref:Glycine zipper 2TM domain-containing protein n=2 Tax=Paraburkholderia humisilvae TaxID=627669 RepID=A0A6J5F2Y2_9BURK|nr:hypothetical protein LMG29542_07139 [Paraburkholderia humisilvae]
MNSNVPQSKGIHPLIAAAACAVILVSVVAVAVMTGVFPRSKGDGATAVAQAASAAPIASAPQSVAPAPQQSAPAAERSRTEPAHSRTEPRYSHRPQNSEPKYTQQPQQYEPKYNQQPQQYLPPQPPYPEVTDRNVGVVESITPIKKEGGDSGLGAVGGAVAGGLLGDQIGNGRGRTAATIAGALGGVLVGNQVEQHLRSETLYQVRVRMPDGSNRVITYKQQPNVAVGQRVRVDNNSIIGPG